MDNTTKGAEMLRLYTHTRSNDWNRTRSVIKDSWKQWRQQAEEVKPDKLQETNSYWNKTGIKTQQNTGEDRITQKQSERQTEKRLM